MKSQSCVSLHRNKGVNIHHKERVEGNRLAIVLYVKYKREVFLETMRDLPSNDCNTKGRYLPFYGYVGENKSTVFLSHTIHYIGHLNDTDQNL
jgi:hypothetical protein